jgi:hypothetical protein
MDIVIKGHPLPDLPRALEAMGVNGADFVWHLADIEASTWPQEINDCWILGADLLATWVRNETKLIWGVLDAFPRGQIPEVVDLPYADGNTSFWAGQRLTPQIEGAVFEIVFWDSSTIIFIGINEGQAASLVNLFPGAQRLNAGDEQE